MCSKCRQFCKLLTSPSINWEPIVCLLFTVASLKWWDDRWNSFMVLKLKVKALATPNVLNLFSLPRFWWQIKRTGAYFGQAGTYMSKHSQLQNFWFLQCSSSKLHKSSVVRGENPLQMWPLKIPYPVCVLVPEKLGLFWFSRDVQFFQYLELSLCVFSVLFSLTWFVGSKDRWIFRQAYQTCESADSLIAFKLQIYSVYYFSKII